MVATATPFTAYITKYALTHGILIAEATLCEHSSKPGTMIEVAPYGRNVYFHGNDWHRTKQGATSRAWEMLSDKIASVNKQLAKLLKMESDASWPSFG